MSHTNNTKPQSKTTTARPQVTSYDGHEHSIEHWIEVAHDGGGIRRGNTLDRDATSVSG